LAFKANPAFLKRQKEQARAAKAKAKEQRKAERQRQREQRGPGGEVEDPDIAGIVPGPQPPPEE